MPARRAPYMLLPMVLLAACRGEPDAPLKPPVKAEAVAQETALLRLTLAREAQSRLGIVTESVGTSSPTASRETSGEIVAPVAGGPPLSSVNNLQQLGLQQVAADAEIARTRAQIALTRIALDRATALVREEAGSLRARDEAAAALATAEAASEAALAQRRLLGPPIGSLDDQATLWVRVPVFGTDLARIERGSAARVRPLGGDGTARDARPVRAPPSANAVTGTVDLYFAIDNHDRAYQVGQRVSVTLQIAGIERERLTVPTSAVIRDIHGGEWVYTKTAPDTFLRQRIEIVSSDATHVVLSRGLGAGMDVVTAGAAELFGSEFGVSH